MKNFIFSRKYERGSERVRDILSAQEDKILIPVRSCNIVYLERGPQVVSLVMYNALLFLQRKQH